jgi:hypothetical protein
MRTAGVILIAGAAVYGARFLRPRNPSPGSSVNDSE